MLLLQRDLSSLGFCSVSPDIFFVFRYSCLPLVLPIDFCNSQLIFVLYISYLKRRKDQTGLNILIKMNSLKKSEVVRLLNFEEGPGILLLNVEGGPEVPLLDFSGVAGHTFKLSGGPGTQVSGSRGLGSWGPGPTFIPYRMGGQ